MACQMPVYQAAEVLRVSERQVEHILAVYRKEGVDALSTGIVDVVADVNTKAEGGNSLPYTATSRNHTENVQILHGAAAQD